MPGIRDKSIWCFILILATTAALGVSCSSNNSPNTPSKSSPTNTPTSTPTPTITNSPTITSTPTPTPTTCHETGDTNTTTATVTHPTGNIYAFAVTLSAAENASAVAIYVAGTATAGNIVLGLYDDNAGAPNNLLASAVVSATSTSWNAVTFSSVALPAGSYWVANSAQSDFGSGPDSSYTTSFYTKTGTYTGALPNPLTGGSASPNHPMPFYIQSCP